MANKKMQLGIQTVSESDEIYLIAEIGINHNGDMLLAKKLMDAVNACGYHCAKFQKRTPDLAVPEAQKNTMRDTPWGLISYLEYKKKIEFGKAEYNYINTYCQEKPINWSCSVWDLPSLDFILQYDVPFIKIPSAMLTNKSLLLETAKSNKPILLSTGMSTLEEIDVAVNILEKESNGNFILMHTNSSYPTPLKELNLKLIPFLKERYNCLVGYSGHEYDLEPTVIAVSLGATIVERHITLDHNMWGTDQKSSLEIGAMILLKNRVKDIKEMLGSGEKHITQSEILIREKLRG